MKQRYSIFHFINQFIKPFSVKIQFKIMNSSIITSNAALSYAYDYIQNGKIESALSEYQKALRDTFSDDLKINIKCTMAILEQSIGHYDKTIEIMSSILASSKQSTNNIVKLRLYTNLTLMHILQGKYTTALDYFESIMEVIQTQTNLQFKKQLLQFTTYLFFRVRNLQEISQFIQNFDLNGMSVQQIYSMSLMAFNSQVCKLECQQKIQKMCYFQFLKYNRFDLAIFSLRTLIHFTKNLVNKQYYQKQLAKLVMMGYFSQAIDFNNFQPYQIIQAITEQFVTYRIKIMEEIDKVKVKQSTDNCYKKYQSSDSEIIVEWKYTICVLVKDFTRSKEMDNDNKRITLQMLRNMREQNNPLVIRNMLKNNYFLKYYERTQNTLRNIGKLLKNNLKLIYQSSFQNIKKFQGLSITSMDISLKNSHEQKNRLSVKHDKSKSLIKLKQCSKQQKQNYVPMGISIVSITSSKITKEKDQSRKKIFQDNHIQTSHKKILKMVKFCEYGCFLNKRNFNSEGGQYKFVKITNSFIKWGKDPQKIQTNCQIYPFKDIQSIIYGRVSPNLNQSSNKMLNYSRCFSLHFHKRTLDFYCKSYQELQAWVCGLTHVLKRQDIRVVGYTPGKLRWKKMFAILKQNFIDTLRPSERNKYYYENAYSLKMFAKNGYKLPVKTLQKK